MEEKVRELLGPLENEIGYNLQQGQSDEGTSEEVGRRCKRRIGYEGNQSKKHRPSKWQVICSKVYALLQKTAICPIEGLKSEACFLEDDFLTDPDNTLKVNEAIKLWSFKINKFSLRNFFFSRRFRQIIA